MKRSGDKFIPLPGGWGWQKIKDVLPACSLGPSKKEEGCW